MTVTLWSFASSCYPREGVAEVCLHAQDQLGADVNMLLAAAWLAACGNCWQGSDVDALNALCEEWRTHCILPLRGVRRYLKQKPAVESLYMEVKMLELNTEKLQLELIEATLRDMSAEKRPTTAALSHNLRVYFEALPGWRPTDNTLARLIAALQPAPD